MVPGAPEDDQVPPGTDGTNTPPTPVHMRPEPAITGGVPRTVTTRVVWQPAREVAVMTVVPAAIAVTTPPPSIVATAPSEEDHAILPPVLTDVVSPPVAPTHNAATPEIGSGVGSAYTDMLLRQPAGVRYVTSVAYVPVAVNSPETESIIATAGLDTDHTPPGTPAVNVADVPWHRLEGPVSVLPGVTVTTI